MGHFHILQVNVSILANLCFQSNTFRQFCVQGPEGDDSKQVKVATVRKDITDLKENFPLHITIGPKVKVVSKNIFRWIFFDYKYIWTLSSLASKTYSVALFATVDQI